MKRTWATALVAAATLVLTQVPAWPQALTRICLESISPNGGINCIPISSSNPFPVTGGTGGGGSGGAITGPLGPSTTAANSVATTFGSGTTLPAFASTPTFNLGTGSIGNTGFAAYGPDATGNAPTKPPVLNGALDANGKVQSVSPTNPLPTADQNATQTITAPGTAAAKEQGVQGNLSGIPVPVLPPSILPTRTLVSVAATSTTLVAAKANRRAIQVACDGTSQVGLSQTGATLTTNTLSGGADTVIPASSANAYIPPFATTSAITAYGTSTAQNCAVTEWLQ